MILFRDSCERTRDGELVCARKKPRPFKHATRITSWHATVSGSGPDVAIPHALVGHIDINLSSLIRKGGTQVVSVNYSMGSIIIKLGRH